MPRNIFSYYDSETGKMSYGTMSENASKFWNALASESTRDYQDEQRSVPAECGFVLGAIPGAIEGAKVAVRCCITGAPGAQQFFGFITVPAGIGLGGFVGGLIGAAACTAGIYTCDTVSCPVTTFYHTVRQERQPISETALINTNGISAVMK